MLYWNVYWGPRGWRGGVDGRGTAGVRVYVPPRGVLLPRRGVQVLGVAAEDDAEATLHGLEDTADHAWEHCSDNGTKPDSPAVMLGGVITPATIRDL